MTGLTSTLAAAVCRWDHQPLHELVAFLVDTYHARLRESLPALIGIAEEVESRHGDAAAFPKQLVPHLTAMQDSVFEHLEKEEQVLFPLILAGQGRLVAGPVHVMELDHDEHVRNIALLRRLVADYQPPADACTTWKALYLGLQQLEEELLVHIHLENIVLFRRALVT